MQGSVKPYTVIEGPDAWKVADWENDKSYIHVLSEQDIAELDAAVQRNAGVEEIQVRGVWTVSRAVGADGGGGGGL